MKAATITELKRELAGLTNQELIDKCLRLAKYKKENKELLGYLLFDEDDQKTYIKSIKEKMDILFLEVKRFNIHFAKKNLRKILRVTNKYIKFSGNKQTEVELLIYFCSKMKASGVRFKNYIVLLNLYERQIQKIEKALTTLHEDLQYDYEREISELLEK